MEYSKYKVCVRCFTFNQAKFIEETMNGFVMQQTNFPFICCIVDDASTDGEQNVIKKYMKSNFAMSDSSIAYEKETDYAHILFAQHNENKSCYFAILLLKNNLYSKREGYKKFHYISEWRDNSEYEALCEGDDYWISANKLQKQADFLDSHPDYGLVHTDFDLVDETRTHYMEKFPDGVYFPYILFKSGIQIQTLTVMYRLSIYKKLPKYFMNKSWLMTDKPLWIEFSKYSKIKYLKEVTAKYRLLDSSASHSSDINKLISFNECGREINNFYAKKFFVQLKDEGFSSDYYDGILKYAYRLTSKHIATKYFFKAIIEYKLTIKGFVFYVGTIFPFLKKIIGNH